MKTLSRCTAQLLLFNAVYFASNGALLAQEPDIERGQLAAVLRQLDALERHAESSAALSHQIAARYHFDYLRLREDIQRVRSGVLDYLTPQRSLPRDPTPMLGEYIGESDRP